MSTAIDNTRSHVSALKWLVLLALAWSQLAFAAHQSHHEPADLGENCAVCLQFDRADDVVLDAVESCSTSASGTSAPAESEYAVPTEYFSPYRARASPRIPEIKT